MMQMLLELTNVVCELVGAVGQAWAAPAGGVVSQSAGALVHGGGGVLAAMPTEPIIDWGARKNNEVRALIIAVGTTVAIAVVIAVGIKTGFNWAKVIITGLVAAAVLWFVDGGLKTTSDQINEEIQSAPVTQVEHVDPFEV